MKKRPLPPCFVRLPAEPMLEVLKQAKAIRLPMNVVLEDLLQRGLSCVKQRQATVDDLEAEYFAYLVDKAPHMLDATQRRILEVSRSLPGLWTRRITLAEYEEGEVDHTPRLDVEALKRAWATLRRKASETASGRAA